MSEDTVCKSIDEEIERGIDEYILRRAEGSSAPTSREDAIKKLEKFLAEKHQ